MPMTKEKERKRSRQKHEPQYGGVRIGGVEGDVKQKVRDNLHDILRNSYIFQSKYHVTIPLREATRYAGPELKENNLCGIE